MPVASSPIVVVSMDDTVFDATLLTHTRRPFGAHATPIGDVPTPATVPMTVEVLVRMMLTEFDEKFATASLDPSGESAMPRGLVPTVIDAVAAPVVVEYAITVLALVLDTHTVEPSRESAE
jgi:hypothetical protein